MTRAILATITVLVVAACSSPTEPTIPVASVSIVASLPSATALSSGSTLQLVAVPRDSKGEALAGRSVEWSSSDTSVAKVSSTGLVTTGTVLGGTAVNATISAKVESSQGTLSLSVLPVPVATVTVSPATPSIQVAGSQVFSVSLKDAAGNTLTGRTVVWLSSDTLIGSVSTTGVVTAKSYTGGANRSITVTATAENRSGAATVTVTPTPVNSVTLSPTSTSLLLGATRQLTAVPKDAAGTVLTGRTITWQSSDTLKAKVSTSGLVTATGGGAATITATTEGVNGTSAITITVPVATVSVTPSTPSIVVGETQQLTATTKDALGAVLTDRNVVWSSSDTLKAKVSTSGLVSAFRVGTVSITATSETKTGTAIITLNPGPAVSLAVVTRALGARVGKVMTTQPVIELRDIGGNRATTSSATITVSVSGGATLSGNRNIASDSGVVRFSDLVLTGGVGAYNLTFTGAGMTQTSDSVRLGLGHLLIATSNADRSCADCDVSIFTEGGSVLRRISLSMYFADLSPDGTQIVYSDKPSHAKLMIANSSTFTTRELKSSWFNFDPQWSPDGTRIVLTEEGVDSKEIFSIKADGTDERRITVNAITDQFPTWSSDGSTIVWQQQSHCLYELLAATAGGENQRKILSYKNCESSVEFPRLSPDGSSLAAVSGANLRVGKTDGTGMSIITQSACPIARIAWSPDGEYLAFSGCTPEMNRDVFIIRKDGKELKNLTNSPLSNEYVTSWR